MCTAKGGKATDKKESVMSRVGWEAELKQYRELKTHWDAARKNHRKVKGIYTTEGGISADKKEREHNKNRTRAS